MSAIYCKPSYSKAAHRTVDFVPGYGRPMVGIVESFYQNVYGSEYVGDREIEEIRRPPRTLAVFTADEKGIGRAYEVLSEIEERVATWRHDTLRRQYERERRDAND